MKKIVLSLIAFITVVMAMLIYFILRPNIEQVQLDQAANVYLFTEKGIRSLSISEKGIKPLKTHQTDLTGMNVFGTVNHLMADRYLVFSEESGNYILSLDMTKQLLKREPTANLLNWSREKVNMGQLGAYEVMDNYLIAYDQFGKEKGRLMLGDEQSVLHSLVASRGYLYLVVDRFGNDDATEKTSQLYVIKEEGLSIVDKINLSEILPYPSYISDLTVVGNALYLIISMYATDDSSDYKTSNVLIALDLKTLEQSTVDLSVNMPQYLYPQVEDSGWLWFDHNVYDTEVLALSAVHLKTGRQETYNLTEVLALSQEFPALRDVTVLSNGLVLLVIDDDYTVDGEEIPERLYLYDRNTNKLVDRFDLAEDNYIGLVVNHP